MLRFATEVEDESAFEVEGLKGVEVDGGGGRRGLASCDGCRDGGGGIEFIVESGRRGGEAERGRRRRERREGGKTVNWRSRDFERRGGRRGVEGVEVGIGEVRRRRSGRGRRRGRG